MNIYMKWFLIICLNSAITFYLGNKFYLHSMMDNQLVHMIAMIAGISTWYFSYVYLDFYLQKTGRQLVSLKLTLSISLRVPLQFTLLNGFIFGNIWPDLIAAGLATTTSEYFGFFGPGFMSSYTVTIFTGLYLSVYCTIIYGLITIVYGIRKKWRVYDSRK